MFAQILRRRNRRHIGAPTWFALASVLFLVFAVVIGLAPGGGSTHELGWMGLVIAWVMSALCALLAASSWHSNRIYGRRKGDEVLAETKE